MAEIKTGDVFVHPETGMRLRVMDVLNTHVCAKILPPNPDSLLFVEKVADRSWIRSMLERIWEVLQPPTPIIYHKPQPEELEKLKELVEKLPTGQIQRMPAGPEYEVGEGFTIKAQSKEPTSLTDTEMRKQAKERLTARKELESKLSVLYPDLDYAEAEKRYLGGESRTPELDELFRRAMREAFEEPRDPATGKWTGKSSRSSKLEFLGVRSGGVSNYIGRVFDGALQAELYERFPRQLYHVLIRLDGLNRLSYLRVEKKPPVQSARAEVTIVEAAPSCTCQTLLGLPDPGCPVHGSSRG